MSVQEQRDLSGIEKASVLLLSLGASKSAQVFKHLSDAEIESLSAKIMGMRHLDPQTRSSVLGEFERVRAERAAEAGSRNFAVQVLERALGREKAGQVVRKTVAANSNQRFAFLLGMDPARIAEILADETHQIAALVLVNLPADVSGETLAHMDQETQNRVAARICKMDIIDPEVVNAVEEGLRQKLQSSQSPSAGVGAKRLAEMLNTATRSTENAVLNALRGGHSAQSVVVFEDMRRLTDESVKSALRRIPNDDLKLAMAGAEQEAVDTIFGNLTERSAGYLREDLDRMGPVKIRDVEAAQDRIAGIIRRMLNDGEAQFTSAREELAA